MSLARFTEKWTSPDYPTEAVSEKDLRSIEQHFEVSLPADYRRAVLKTGLPRPTITLLDAIVVRDLDIHSIGDFYSPTEIVEETISWRELGMPDQLIAIASDGCGNKFCFDVTELRAGETANQAVWFFDHDFGTVDQIATSFDAWIATLCEVEELRPART